MLNKQNLVLSIIYISLALSCPAGAGFEFTTVDEDVVGLWHFNETSGEIAYDASPRGHHARWNHGWTFDTNQRGIPPERVPGQSGFNNALRLHDAQPNTAVAGAYGPQVDNPDDSFTFLKTEGEQSTEAFTSKPGSTWTQFTPLLLLIGRQLLGPEIFTTSIGSPTILWFSNDR